MQAKSNIKYAYFIEGVSRKFTLRKNVCTAKDAAPLSSTLQLKLEPTRYMGGQVRTTYRAGLGTVTKNVMFLRFNPRTSQITADEQSAQNAFKAAVAKRKLWLETLADAAAIASDMRNDSVVARGGVPKKGYTLRGWVFAVAYRNPSAEHWPAN